MLGNPIRCCTHARHISPNVLDINLKNFIAGFGTHKACYSKDKGCTDVPQTENRDIEPWPKPDPPPPAWRCECPRDPQPVNYDPYRIKVPEIAVPPLPGGQAKELPTDAAELFKNACATFGTDPNFAPLRDLFHNSPVVHPDYWKEQPTKKQLSDPVGEVVPRLGYHGRSKYKFAFHEPWKPLDRMGLLEEAEKEENALSREIGAVATAEKEA